MDRLSPPFVTLHGGDAFLELPGLLQLRASFLSEGLFDEDAGGDPAEEDLYEIELTCLRGLLPEELSFSRLLPAAPQSWLDESDEASPVERFLLVLAGELAQAPVSRWPEICRAARAWDPWMIADALDRLPWDTGGE